MWKQSTVSWVWSWPMEVRGRYTVGPKWMDLIGTTTCRLGAFPKFSTFSTALWIRYCYCLTAWENRLRETHNLSQRQPCQDVSSGLFEFNEIYLFNYLFLFLLFFVCLFSKKFAFYGKVTYRVLRIQTKWKVPTPHMGTELSLRTRQMAGNRSLEQLAILPHHLVNILVF